MFLCLSDATSWVQGDLKRTSMSLWTVSHQSVSQSILTSMRVVCHGGMRSAPMPWWLHFAGCGEKACPAAHLNCSQDHIGASSLDCHQEIYHNQAGSGSKHVRLSPACLPYLLRRALLLQPGSVDQHHLAV
jgi:hypothetical protein